MMKPLLTTLILLNFGCMQTKPINVVDHVDLQKYQGTWYEILRLPNFFEKRLDHISANYTLRNDGKITVLNSGYKIKEPGVLKTSKGVAWLPNPAVTAKLKVRFFWPFSGDYWILALENNYRYVMVGDPSRKYLWILCREKTLDENIIQHLLDDARGKGFDISKIIRTNQT